MDEPDGNEVKATAADRSALIPIEPPAEILEVDPKTPVEQFTEDAEKTEDTEEIAEIDGTTTEVEANNPESQSELETRPETNVASELGDDQEEVDDIVAGAPDQTPDSSELLIEESLKPTETPWFKSHNVILPFK